MQTTIAARLAGVLLACAGAAAAVEPVGTPADVAHAERLWRALARERLVGPGARPDEPFFAGARPHGIVIEVLTQRVTVDGHSGFTVVKRNYGGEGVSVAKVAAEPQDWLEAVTVMFKREAGYDPENLDWFWVKYRPDGTLFEAGIDGERRALAGRIVKGETPERNGGCLWCHRSAAGGDYVFYRWIEVPE